MTDDNLAWFEDMVRATQQAAGLPAGWGTTPTPLGPDADLEDGPRPSRLRAGMSTAELLPYGDVVHTPDGQDLMVERLVCAPIRTPGGGVEICDPTSAEWQGPPLGLDLRGSEQPVEVAALRRATPRGDILQGAVAVVGDVSAVTSWVEFPVPGTRVLIDKGCGAFMARDHVAAVADRAEALLPVVGAVGLTPVEVDGVVVGALFDSGDGPGGYEVMLGRGRSALPLALLVDLRVLPR
ncbi:hypothetical protein [Nocardioides sp. P5_C9_2]